MKYNLRKDTFFVKEIFTPNLKENGEWNYYLLTKSGISDKEVRRRIPKDSLFCGKKDRNATTTQWFCSRNKIDNINEENLKLEFFGVSNEKLFIGAHKGNKFRVIVELNEIERKKIKKTNFKKILIANYFGPQRFDERIEKFNEFLEKEEYESALKYFLCEKSKFDSEKSCEIKKEIETNWSNWEELIISEKIPESKKPIFEFLRNGNNNYLEAFEFVERKSLITMLKATQAKRFNQILEKEIDEKIKNNLSGFLANKSVKKKIEVEANDFERNFGLKKLVRNSYFSP